MVKILRYIFSTCVIIFAGLVLFVSLSAKPSHSSKNDIDLSSYKSRIEKCMKDRYNIDCKVKNLVLLEGETWMDKPIYRGTAYISDNKTFGVEISKDKKTILDNYAQIQFSSQINDLIDSLCNSNKDKVSFKDSLFVYEYTDKQFKDLDDYLENSGSYLRISTELTNLEFFLKQHIYEVVENFKKSNIKFIMDYTYTEINSDFSTGISGTITLTEKSDILDIDTKLSNSMKARREEKYSNNKGE